MDVGIVVLGVSFLCICSLGQSTSQVKEGYCLLSPFAPIMQGMHATSIQFRRIGLFYDNTVLIDLCHIIRSSNRECAFTSMIIRIFCSTPWNKLWSPWMNFDYLHRPVSYSCIGIGTYRCNSLFPSTYPEKDFPFLLEITFWFFSQKHGLKDDWSRRVGNQ